MNQYRELRKRQQDEVNAFPLGFAFSDKQFREMMSKWELDPKKDLDKISRIPVGGGFIQKKDIPAFKDLMKRHDDELQAAIDGDSDGTGFIYQMFRYELDNHEYGYTGDVEDTLDTLGLTAEDIETDSRLRAGLKKACREIMRRES